MPWRLAIGAAPLLLTACAASLDAPRLAYQCPQRLSFEVRLYEDMALVEGMRGHAVLGRVPAAEGDTEAAAALRYADSTVQATFGLGVDQRLARLLYPTLPEPVYCQRAPTVDNATPAPVRAQNRPGPRPPAPFNPDAPVETNILRSDGNNGPG